MARISVKRAGAIYRVALRGRLVGRDLKRLERACGYALEHALLPLELHLEHVSLIDDVARTYLEQLRIRGAQLFGDPALFDGAHA